MASKKLDDIQLAGVLKHRIDRALGQRGDQVSRDRADAYAYYIGAPFGDEQDGRSQMVARVVAEAVDSTLPALLAIFCSGDQIARWEPRTEKDVESAKQATDYTNWVVMEQNPGFLIFHHWFKDALVYNVGIAQIDWDETEEITKEEYEGLNDDELTALQTDDEVKIIEQTDRMVDALDEGLLSFSPMQSATVHDVTVERTRNEGKVRVEVVPPEEFLIEQVAVSEDDTYVNRMPGIGRRRRMTVSELVQMGYDQDTVMAASTVQENLNLSSPERIERFRDTPQVGQDTMPDDASREVTYTEWYDTVDVDGDGIAERRKFCLVGDSNYQIIANEECDYGHPYSALCPFPMPHKFFGEGLADKTKDLQRLSSTLWRQTNDNLYLSNAPRMFLKGNVNIDDVLNTRIGAVIRGSQDASLEPISVPFVADASFKMLEYLDKVRGQRVGVTEYSQGLDTDVLTKTATGTAMLQTAAMQRQELIARIFAETGVKRLFWLVLHFLTKYSQKEQIVRLRDQQFVTMDPREWTNRMDLTVTVGIGSGSRPQQLQQVMALLQMDAQIVQLQGGANGPLLTLPNIHAKLERAVELMGLKNANSFYSNPVNAPPQQPQPNPEMMKAQAQMAIQAQKSQQQAQLDQQRTQAQMQTDALRAQHEMSLDQQRLQHEALMQRIKLQNDATVQAMKAHVDMAVQKFTAIHAAKTKSEQASE